MFYCFIRLQFAALILRLYLRQLNRNSGKKTIVTIQALGELAVISDRRIKRRSRRFSRLFIIRVQEFSSFQPETCPCCSAQFLKVRENKCSKERFAQSDLTVISEGHTDINRTDGNLFVMMWEHLYKPLRPSLKSYLILILVCYICRSSKTIEDIYRMMKIYRPMCISKRIRKYQQHYLFKQYLDGQESDL